jgi:hypothetical protein
MDERAICRRYVKSSQRAAASVGASPKVMYPLSSTSCVLLHAAAQAHAALASARPARGLVVVIPDSDDRVTM